MAALIGRSQRWDQHPVVGTGDWVLMEGGMWTLLWNMRVPGRDMWDVDVAGVCGPCVGM